MASMNISLFTHADNLLRECIGDRATLEILPADRMPALFGHQALAHRRCVHRCGEGALSG
jgi:hypothetical protein